MDNLTYGRLLLLHSIFQEDDPESLNCAEVKELAEALELALGEVRAELTTRVPPNDT